jgi:hypothetical protein
LSKTVITADQKTLHVLTEALFHPRCCGGIIEELVELTGIEPATYGLQSRRSPS